MQSRNQAVPKQIIWMIVASALILFGCSSVRHALFQSGAFDLGYFDQAIYLISQGLPPIVSFWGYHFLGGHADWILYPLALLYKVYPSVHWLFAIQAIALSITALPIWHLGQQAGLKPVQATTIATAYLLYPLVFNLNLFDFHPEVIALPLLLYAVLAARNHQFGWFVGCIALALGCRDALSLTVAAMGIWLLVFEKQRLCGTIAIVAGVAWFLIATQVIIPHFRPAGVEATLRYAYLGDSVLEIAKNLILQPHLVLSRVLSLATLEYLALLLAPLLWGLHIRHLTPLVAAVPMLVMNILSDSPTQRNLVHQYSLPILPFLMLAIIGAVAADHAWLKWRSIVLWSLIGFLTLGKYEYFGSLYLRDRDTWKATRAAIAQVHPQGAVLTTHTVVPQLTHRPVIRFALADAPPTNLEQYDFVLLNLRHPGWRSTPAFTSTLIQQLQRDRQFEQRYQQDDVYLFVKRSNLTAESNE